MPSYMHKMKDKKRAKELRNKYRKRNYNITTEAENRRQRWQPWEIIKVVEHTIPDRQLSAEIGRSVQAIQVQRVRYKYLKDLDLPLSLLPKEED